ncbi:long-chain fatty acid--CoA ligase [Nocardia sp. NPDC046763]|uniref:AMP-dependent synthetase/ligase n=1 Tax=Nocardia sp. NPDC046763 TaxID=3155256 RepID=UPI0033DD7250
MNRQGNAPETLCAAFQQTAAAHPDKVAIRTPGDEVVITWREYAERVRSIATGLAGLGVGRGDTVALMLTNRPEFHLCDTAVLHTGATPFSVYNTNPPEVLGYQFDNADAKVVICESQFLPQVRSGMQLGGKVEHIVCLDAAPGVLALADVEAALAADFDFEASWRAVRPEDVLTIVYTSGTTGMPKGVEITHANQMASARVIDELMEQIGGMTPDDGVISYLPDAHMANRWVSHYFSMKTGVRITDVADPKQVIAALTEVRPTLFLGVPRIWVKVKAGLEAKVAAESPARRVLLPWALGAGRAIARANTEGRQPDLIERLQYAAAQPILAKVRAQLGIDKLRVAVSAAAPIPVEVLEFAVGLGIPVCEAWGLTEGTCALTINRPDALRIGTVGTPVPGAEIELGADGEVLARGPMIMRGYRKAPEKTAEAIDSDGWLHTGDIGELDDAGYLRIVDRKKELIINAAGKNMSPSNIENALTANISFAGPVVTIGDGRRYNTALITLDPEAVAEFAAQQGISGPVACLAENPTVRAAVAAGVDAANRTLSRVEQIKKFTVLADVWEPGGEYLTPTTKLKRKPIAAGYADRIDAMY